MAIAFRAATTGTFATTADVTISAPAGLADGDLIIVAITTDNIFDIGTAPSGWTEIGDQTAMYGDTELLVYAKIAASEGASWSWTGLFTAAQSGVYGCVAYSGGDQSTSFDVASVFQQADATDVPASGAIEPTNPNCMIVSVFGADTSAGFAATPDAAPECTERVDANNGALGSIYIQDHLQTTAVSETHEANTNKSDNWAVGIMALRPAAGAGGVSIPVVMLQHDHFSGGMK